MSVRYGMVGGGEGAFIGAVHRSAAALAGNLELVAGAFSSDPERSLRSGLQLGVSSSRTSSDFSDLIRREARLDPSERMQAVVVVTPNHLHAPVASLALSHGFHVLCEKPVADSLESAESLRAAEQRSGRILAVVHNYTGYPLIRQARDLVTSGDLGPVRRVVVSYTQGWLSQGSRLCDSKQGQWRTDPARSGESGAFADIGSHAFYLAEFVTGIGVEAVCAELTALPGRSLDDDGAALLRFENGARGVLVASQVCAGDANNLSLAVYCERGGVHWRQEAPDALVVRRDDRPETVFRAGVGQAFLSASASQASRLPPGHPEGYIEALSNLYRAFADDVERGCSSPEPQYARLTEALRVMRFIRGALTSSAQGGSWVSLRSLEPEAKP
jgi:predicted dehydrogenase